RGPARIPPRVVRLPERQDLPDAVFVEDTAVAVGETLVLARPGAPERRQEVEDVRAALLLAGGRRRIEAIREPGTLDGGDVLALGRRVFVGRSSRTNQEGARQLAEILGEAPTEHEVTTVPVARSLHLKTAASALPAGDGGPAVLVNPRWVDPAVFAPAEVVEVPEEEPFAANVLTLPGPDGEPTVLLSARWPRTRRLLEERGLRTVPLDLSELEKAEAGPTCLCLLVEVGGPG
ncbi:MAG TPA: arginine deiminase family protein, partial [Thermoanaerobaculia bacterium]